VRIEDKAWGIDILQVWKNQREFLSCLGGSGIDAVGQLLVLLSTSALSRLRGFSL
jgi:hypothetical protein